MTDWRELPPRGLPPGSRLAEGRLANGLEVRLAEVPAARQARLALGVAAGWLDEPPRHRGLAHLLEHCLFHPHPRREGLALADWVGAVGGRYNARTSEATTDYHLSLPAAQLAEGLARLVDLVAAPDLLADEAAPEAVAREIAVIDAEFRARRGDPALHRLAALSRLVAAEHPARGCHAGHRLSLDGVTSAALRHFHRRHYRAPRMVLASLAPQPLAQQWAALCAAGQRLPAGDEASAGRRAVDDRRWAGLGGVAWRSPGVSGALELLWPLRPGIRAQHAAALEALALGLEDGELAAALCRRGWLQDLSATAWPEGAGEALALTLRLSESGERHWGEAAELCRSRLASLLARSDDPGAPARLPEEALATWPQRQVRRHCALNRCRAEAPAPAVQLSGTLPRLLLACRELPPGQVRRVPESATPWVPLAWPRRGPPPPPWPGEADPGPWVVASQRRGHQGPRRCAERPVTVWRGGTSRRPWLCLGWPAAGERLAAWETASLPLRQAFRARGGELWLGEDARGAWLALRGEEALPPVAMALLEAWPRAAPPRAPGAGLLAQRLLARLSQVEATPSLPLCWAEAPPAAMLRRRLLAVASAAVAGDRPDRPREASVAPAGEGTALMLLLQGKSTPLERLCLRLLAQCHDRPFLVEMRERRGLGYVAAVRYREAAGQPRLGYVVQSPGADAETLRLAIEDFLAVQGRALLPSGGDELARRLAALRADLAVPESEAEAWRCQWQALREGTCEPDWRRLERALEALDGDVLRGCLERLLARPDAWQWHRLQAAACHLGRSEAAGERHSSAISPRSGAP